MHFNQLYMIISSKYGKVNWVSCGLLYTTVLFVFFEATQLAPFTLERCHV